MLLLANIRTKNFPFLAIQNTGASNTCIYYPNDKIHLNEILTNDLFIKKNKKDEK